MQRPVLAAAVLLLAGCTAPLPPPAGEPSGDLVIYERLTCRSDLAAPLTEVATDQAQWAALWAKLCAAGIPDGEPPRPGVDFTTRWVLASAWGAKPTGGFEVRILSVEERSDEVVAHVERTAPGAGCVVTEAITHPLDIVVAARVAKPVRFEQRDLVRDCTAPPPPAEEPASPWRFVWEPAAASGPLGPARFTLRALPNASAPPGQLVPGPYVKLDGSADARNLTASGGSWAVDLVLGGEPRVAVQWENPGRGEEDPGRIGYATVEGPALTVQPGDVPVRGEARRDAADAGAGLHASAAGRNVTAVFSMGTIEGLDCMENVTLRNATAAVAGNVTVVRAVIDTVASDACLADAPAHTPRVVLEVGPVATDAVEVVVYTYHSCFCLPRGGWDEHRARVDVA